MTDITDTDPRDATVVDYLQARTRADVPDSFSMGVMRMVDRVPQERPGSLFGPMLTRAAAAAATVLVAFVAVTWYASQSASGPGPSQVASSSATLRASTTPAASTPFVPAGLLRGPATCINTTDGFQVAVPVGWYTNVAATDVETPSCRYFAPEPFATPRTDSIPPEARVTLGLRRGAFAHGGQTENPRQLEIGGMPAERLEITGVPGAPLVVYTIGVDGELPSEATESWMLVETDATRPGELADNVAALDAIAMSVERLGASPTPFPTADFLLAGPATCADFTWGFQLDVPPGWYTSQSVEDNPSCRVFTTEPFQVSTSATRPEPRIEARTGTGDYGPGGTVEDRRELEINGHPALRLVVRGEAGGVLPADTVATVYLIGLDGELPSETTTGRWLEISTSTQMPGDPDENVAALDQMAATAETLR